MNLMRYLLEANLYLAAFYLLYLFLLRKETYYQLSRAYLLASGAVAFIIPLLQLGILKPQTQTFTSVSVIPNFDPREFQNLPVVVAPPPVHVWSVFDYVLLAYGVITTLLVINLYIKICKLIRLSKRNARHTNNGFVLVEVEEESAAFSFMSYLFIDAKMAASETVIRHEQVHIRQKHSWDIIYTELLKVINWFNPFVYLMQNSLKEIHEFIADQHTAELENSNDNYAAFLISNAYGMPQNVLTNSFSHKNMLRKRIIMLYQKRSGKPAKLKYALALPLIGGLLCLSTMAFTDKSYALVDIFPQHIQAKLAQLKLSSKAMFKHDIVADETDDTVKVGNKTITALVLEKPTSSTDTVIKAAKKSPLVVINGKVLPLNIGDGIFNKGAKQFKISDTKTINVGDIKSISVLKDKAATSLYGEDGAFGVVLITTKDYNGSESGAMKNVSPTNGTAIQTVTLTPPDSSKNQIFTAVEVQPIPKDGIDGFYQFLGNHIKYPAQDKEKGIQGRVIIQFIVEKDGTLSNMDVKRSPSVTLADEAIRVLKLSPAWNPGLQKGKPVRVQYTIPINFSLETKTPLSLLMGRDVIFTAVEVEPTPKGGLEEFYRFLGNNIKYPAEDKKNGIQGRVIVQFVVEKDGSFSDIKIMRQPSETLGNEAIRVLNLAPKWNPGIQNGRTVRVQYTIPINFSLSNDGDKSFDAFYKQLSNAIKYPAEAKEKNNGGRMLVTFSLDADKQIKNVRILRGFSKVLDDEVIKNIQNCKSVPNGKPGTTYVLPVFFALKDSDGKNIGTTQKDIDYIDNPRPNTTGFVPLSQVVITAYK
jgi:TonB family protein